MSDSLSRRVSRFRDFSSFSARGPLSGSRQCFAASSCDNILFIEKVGSLSVRTDHIGICCKEWRSKNLTRATGVFDAAQSRLDPVQPLLEDLAGQREFVSHYYQFGRYQEDSRFKQEIVGRPCDHERDKEQGQGKNKDGSGPGIEVTISFRHVFGLLQPIGFLHSLQCPRGFKGSAQSSLHRQLLNCWTSSLSSGSS